MKVLYEFSNQVTRSISKVTRDVKILLGVRKSVSKNINKRLDIIMEDLDISIKVDVMIGRVHSLKELL
jgi:hypothetical protein